VIFNRNAVVVSLVFCICSVMFVALPIRSQVSPVYDPWADVSGLTIGQPDGVINMRDIAYEVSLFNTHGTPMDRTQVNNGIELEQLLQRIIQKNYTDWYNGLVGYWKLDEGSGNITSDSSGNGNNGTIINPTWVDGKYGKALSFNGSSFATVPDSQSLRVQNFTLETWVYLDKRPYEYGAIFPIMNKFFAGPEGDYLGWNLLFWWANSTDDNLAVLIGMGQGYLELIKYNSINDLTLNQWHQITATYDGYTATLYIDGISRISKTYSVTYGIYDLGYDLTFAKDGLWYSTFAIDEVIIYNRSLSAEEVMLHYLIPPP
jgi:hypothetical protein